MPWRNRAAPRATVVTPALETTDWLSALVVYQAEGCHQVVEATVMTTVYPGRPADVLGVAAWAENAAVRLRYTWWDDDPEDWFGYVASSRVEGSESDDKYGYAVTVPIVYTLVGASMPMQTQASRAWTDTSPSYIARTLAHRYALEPHVEVSKIHFDQRMQTQSDWAFLADLTSRIGYRLYLDRTELWFVDRATVMPSSDATVPTFTQRKLPAGRDTLRQFEATVGDTDPAGGLRSTWSTVGLSRTTGQLTAAAFQQRRLDSQGRQVAPVLHRQYTARPANSYRDAVGILTSDTDWLWVHARAITDGDPRLQPGSVVDLQGSAIGSTNLGLWMVRAATHRIAVNFIYPQKSEYTTELVLGRDQPGSLGVVLPAAPGPVPDPVLVDGRWRASYIGRA